jgi:hypothetical protein
MTNKDFNNISNFAKFPKVLDRSTNNEKKPQALTRLNLRSPRKRHLLPFCRKSTFYFISGPFQGMQAGRTFSRKRTQESRHPNCRSLDPSALRRNKEPEGTKINSPNANQFHASIIFLKRRTPQTPNLLPGHSTQVSPGNP